MDIQTLTMFFQWCTILNGALLIFSSIICIAIPDWIYAIHSKWFPMPRESFNVVLYAYLGLFKIVFLALNVVPYAALLIVG